jgi:hypothetical protein
MKHCLFIDELGESTPKRHSVSPLFIITGCVVEKDKIAHISNNFDHIKFKYWNDTKIVFHSKDIGRKSCSFKIFRNKSLLFKEFINDLYNFLNNCPLNIIGVIVNQSKSFQLNWGQRTVIKSAYNQLFINFLYILIAKNSTGEIIQEASTPIQDITIYEKFFELQALGLPSDNISHLDVKSRMTALSFVTKKNLDSIAQIADLLAYGLSLNYKVKHKKLTLKKLNPYQKMIYKISQNKLYLISSNTSQKKKEKYKSFTSQAELP